MSGRKFDASKFPRYAELSRVERFLLRHCCYFPIRPALHEKPALRPVTESAAIFREAFGPEFFERVRGKAVLDVGCGHGEFTVALAHEGAGRAVGLDIQDHFRLARAQAAQVGVESRVEFVLGECAQFPDGAFDVVVSHDAFEHFSDPAGMLREMVRVCAPGGWLYLKFGPPWKNPWGRHMNGTFRHDRPWLHLIFRERQVMRVHSVYHNAPVLLERYAQRPGGLNQMTIRRFRRLLAAQEGVRVCAFHTVPLRRQLRLLAHLPGLREYFSAEAMACLRKVGAPATPARPPTRPVAGRATARRASA
jgi:2-polyprenyl-3-methyl-5-hydroxy-6-metoxy-1,4-benzoquinol methylase